MLRPRWMVFTYSQKESQAEYCDDDGSDNDAETTIKRVMLEKRLRRVPTKRAIAVVMKSLHVTHPEVMRPEATIQATKILETVILEATIPRAKVLETMILEARMTRVRMSAVRRRVSKQGIEHMPRTWDLLRVCRYSHVPRN